MSLLTPMWIIQTQKGISFRIKLQAGFHARTGCDSTAWQGILLECFSVVLRSAEITEKMWYSWDAELFICKIQCAKVRTPSTWPGQSIIYARNSAPNKWCTLFSHQTDQLSGSNLATMNNVICSTPPPPTPRLPRSPLHQDVNVTTAVTGYVRVPVGGVLAVSMNQV